MNVSHAPWCLSCERLSVRRGPREVLHEIDLEIRSGECVSLIGPNGSGKTTLMLALLGLLPPTRGHVRLDGVALARLSSRQRGRFAAYVPQTIEHLPAFSVYDVVAGGRYPHVAALAPLSQDDERVVATALARCGLRELAPRPISAVSGGERQKALLAAAIAQDAQALFLDEPNTALDPAYQVELGRLLHAWHSDGRTIVLISHDLQLPGRLGGRVVALRDARVCADGPAAEVLSPERLARIYDTPFDRAVSTEGREVLVPRW